MDLACTGFMVRKDMLEKEETSLLRLGKHESSEFLSEFQDFIKTVLNSDEQGFGRKTYDSLMSLEVYAGTRKLLEGELIEIVNELGFEISEQVHMYWLEQQIVITFSKDQVPQIIKGIDNLDGMDEFIFFDESRTWLLFYDHYDNCKYLTISE